MKGTTGSQILFRKREMSRTTEKRKTHPVYVNLVDEEEESFAGQHNSINQAMDPVNKTRSGVGNKSSTTLESLDLRTEGVIGKTRQAEVFSDEDDDFVAPAERFRKSKNSRLQTHEPEDMKNMVTFGAFQKADKITKKRTRQAEGTVKSNMDAAINEGSQRGPGHKVIVKKGIKLSRVGGGNFAISRYPFKRTEGSKICPPAKNPKIQKDNQKAVQNKLRIVYAHKILT